MLNYLIAVITFLNDLADLLIILFMGTPFKLSPYYPFIPPNLSLGAWSVLPTLHTHFSFSVHVPIGHWEIHCSISHVHVEISCTDLISGRGGGSFG